MGVSVRTGFKWWRRFREQGLAGLQDRSSRPHEIPNQTAPERTELVLRLRRCRLRRARSQPSCECRDRRCRRCSSGMAWDDSATWNHPSPSCVTSTCCRELLHLDVKKLARIRGIGHRITGDRDSSSWCRLGVRSCRHRRLLAPGLCRSAGERRGDHHGGFPATGAGLLSHSWHPDPPRTHGQRQELHVASFQGLCLGRAIEHRRTKPYRPCTNGKAERFIQTLLREWAYKRPYTSSQRRTAALPRWLTDTTTIDHTVVLAEITNRPGGREQ